MAIRPDLTGDDYHAVLQRLHRALAPKTYLEIGSRNGASLQLASCASIAVDPAFDLTVDVTKNKPSCHLFRQTSDAFFSAESPREILRAEVDFAFLDGLHLFECLLRDFFHTERHCKPNTIIAIHDCMPVETALTRRDEHQAVQVAPHHEAWWTGDVWKIVPILKQYRPDLIIHAIDAHPTGLVLVTNLDPLSKVLATAYFRIIEEWRSVGLGEYGIDRLFDLLGLIATSELMTDEQISRRFWL
ncbi:MAG: class I SAM-dependent methyltransferase [Acidisphaera sp.]|nr:class I SAM-dependent methyltransferase [Acidisphaera sp.]